MGGRPSHLIFSELRTAEVRLRRMNLPRAPVNGTCSATITPAPSPTPEANLHHGLAKGYDHHKAVALGEVRRVDPEGRRTSALTPASLAVC